MKELNGFTIEKFNQYDLPQKAKTSTCPECSHTRKKKKDKCLGINWEKGMANCFHCGVVLQLHTYKSNKSQTKPYKLPEPVNTYKLSEKTLKFFEGRKIGLRALNIAKVSEGKEWMPQFKGEVLTIQFNYFINNKLINVKYRGPKKAFKLAKDAELIVSGIDRWIHEDEVIIVEGEIDELSYIEAGFTNVSSVPNGGSSSNLTYLDNCYQYFENKKKIYLSVDSDEVGQKLQNELIRRLGADRCYLVDLGDYKDANEALFAEGVEYLQNAILSSKECPLDNVKNYNDIQQSYHDYIINGCTPGYGIGINQFDKIFTTYTRQYIVVTGIPTHGKSDFVDQMCIGYSFNYGWKTAFCSPENQPEYLHTDKIIRKIYGKKVEAHELDTGIFKLVEDYYKEHFYHIDYKQGYDLESVLEKGAELVKRYGIRCLVIDPYNKVPLKGVSKQNTNVYTTEYLNRIDNWCKQYDCLVILVAHPNKMHIKGEKTMPEPSFYDVKGGGEFYDMSYHGLLVYRDFELEAVKVKVLKCKFANLGENQAYTYLMWNQNNGRYSETEGDEIEGLFPLWDNSSWLQLQEEEQIKTVDYEGFDKECGF